MSRYYKAPSVFGGRFKTSKHQALITGLNLRPPDLEKGSGAPWVYRPIRNDKKLGNLHHALTGFQYKNMLQALPFARFS